MKVSLVEVSGLGAAVASIYISKNHLEKYKKLVGEGPYWGSEGDTDDWNEAVDKMFRIGQKHTTILRFIDFTFLVEGMHRAGQDDWDSHAKRFANRIVRLSTRYSKVDEGAMSDWYKEKIIPTDVMAKDLEIKMPAEVLIGGKNYIKTTNGYVDEQYKDDQDVLRGLYMLSLPSSFIFKCDLAEFAHVYRMRNQYSGAHPEVKELCQKCVEIINKTFSQVNHTYLFNVRD